MTRSLRRTSASRRRRLTGLLFVSPWIVGVLAFVLGPMGQSVFYMFNDVTVEPGGMKSVYVGGDILQDVLLDDPQNVRMMLTSIAQTLGEVLLIVAFSGSSPSSSARNSGGGRWRGRFSPCLLSCPPAYCSRCSSRICSPPPWPRPAT